MELFVDSRERERERAGERQREREIFSISHNSCQGCLFWDYQVKDVSAKYITFSFYDNFGTFNLYLLVEEKERELESGRENFSINHNSCENWVFWG